MKSCGCFVEGTHVETPTGLVAIEDIKVGDIVLAYNEQTGEIVSEPVTGLIRPEPKATFALTFKGDQGESDSFRATADHPWYTADHRWVHTEDLKAGDRIETATGEDFTLMSVRPSSKIERTYLRAKTAWPWHFESWDASNAHCSPWIGLKIRPYGGRPQSS